MANRLKTYVLTVSQVFPKTHPRAGESTFFRHKIEMCFQKALHFSLFDGRSHSEVNIDPIKCKIHTLRGNYQLWKKRIDDVNAGKAVLSVRQWSGKPYASKQVEFLQLNKVGISRAAIFRFNAHGKSVVGALVDGYSVDPFLIAKNDGLSWDDFTAWFKGDHQDLAMIHFTDFRYPQLS